MKFRKRPVVIEAARWMGQCTEELPHWCDGMIELHDDAKGRHLTIRTLEGVMCAAFGDWIILGTKGEVYPCKPDIFEETYEPVKED